ncbi:MAG: hypothetical protein ABEI52_06105 [Halobacteriaceae archaeon]
MDKANSRASLQVEDLLKVVLLLIAVWLVLEIVATILKITLGVFELLQPFIGIILLILIILWLFDRI